MSLGENGNGFVTTMPVMPSYGGGGFGNGGFGGDWGWIILLLLCAGGGWGGFGGGFGGFAGGYEFPWLMNGQQEINSNTNNGFRDALINDNITSVRDGVSALSTQLCGCCGDIQNSLCNGFNGVTNAVNGAQNALAQQMYTNQIADLERSYNAQTATTQGMNNIGMSLQNCCCENRANIADLKYTVATENCQDRQALSDGIRDVIANNTAQTQVILDKLCALELDGYKRENDQLRSQLNMATLRESQTAQNAFIQQGFSDEVDQLYNRLSNCPVPSTPVYGRTPIFTCNQNNCGCNCGCGMG
jgi:hypothetical protein